MFEKNRKKINSELENFLLKQEFEIEESSEAFKKVIDFILRGGKRIRPMLFLEGYRLGGGKRFEECLKASLSLELLHNYLLVHDDIMDRDELRRGGRTLHRMFEKSYDEWTSLSLAIVFGDFIRTLSLKSILDSDFPPKRKQDAIEEIVKMEKSVIEGQALDLILQSAPIENVDLQDVLKLYEMKTSSYTISGPLKAGFSLSPKCNGNKEEFEEYGRKVGLAFQIKDDLLGIFGSEELTGKPSTSDIEERKKTVPIILALKLGTENEKKRIKSYMEKPPDPESVSIIRDLVESTGAKARSENMASSLVGEGKRALKDFKSDFLTSLSDLVIERNY